MEGDYQFCIDNSFSRFSDKVVFFELMTDEEDERMQMDMDYDMESNYEMKIEDFRVSVRGIRFMLCLFDDLNKFWFKHAKC